jgi:hypothetical protein
MKVTSSIAAVVAAYGLIGATLAQGGETPAAPAASNTSSAPAQTVSEPAADTRRATQATPDKTASTPSTTNSQAAAGAADKDQKSAAITGGQKSSSDPLAASVIDEGQLNNSRGGEELAPVSPAVLNQNNTNGNVSGNVATNITTGSNSISDSAFSNSSGVPVVIQNTGNNVLIQNSTIVNLQMAAPK